MEVGAVIAIIQVVDRAIGLCKFYVETAKDANVDLRSILLETSMLKAVLENLKLLIQQNAATPGLSYLSGPDGVIETCEKTVKELITLFPADIVARSQCSKPLKRKRDIATYLAWPLKKAKAERLRAEITRCRENIVLAITADSAQDLKEIKARTIRIEESISEAEKRQVLEWIAHTDPSSLFNRAYQQYEPGTGDWVLRSSEWADWWNGKSRCLWINGIPGAGKTVLSSHLINELEKQCKITAPEKVASIYYFCYFAHNQNETSPFLRWTIHELCRQAGVIPQSVYAMFKRRHEPPIQELENMLEDCLALFSCVFVTIDALDESQDRFSLLLAIETLATGPRFSKIQLLATSRVYVDIERSLKPFAIAFSLDNELVEHDIRRYVRAAITKEHKLNLGRWPQPMLELVVDIVPKKAKGMFRWAVCQLDLLRHLKPEAEVIEEALNDLPSDLDATYERIFNLLRKEDRPLARYTLAWIHSFIRKRGPPIRQGTLVQGLRRSPEVTSQMRRRHIDGDTLRDICGCLIRILPASREADQTVSFAHYTVLEYVSSGRLPEALTYFALESQNLDAKVASVILKTALDPTEYVVEYASKEEFYSSEEFPTDIIVFALHIAGYPRFIATRYELIEDLAISFVNPLMPHFQKLMGVYRVLEPISYSRIGELWEIQWQSAVPSNSHCVHLIQLIFSLIQPDVGDLVRLVKRFPISEILAEKISFTILLRETLRSLSNFPIRWSFDGMLVEALILVAFMHHSKMAQDLWTISTKYLENLHGDSDTTSLIALATLSSINLGCAFTENDRLMRALLQRGDPNGSRLCVSPLQIAVRYGNVPAVRLLLRAGADPNHAGNPEGVPWEDRSLLSSLNSLCGRSPLDINRYKDTLDEVPLPPDLRAAKYVFEAAGEIEMLLLEHGSVDVPYEVTE